MDRGRAFDAWAPAGSIWAPWAKPVLFAHIVDREAKTRALEPPAWAHETSLLGPVLDVSYREIAPRIGRSKSAIIVDLPGAEGVAAGLALAALGFRPVPLYTAIPGLASIVEMDEVVDAIRDSAAALEAMEIDREAPPAFLLDARRRGGAGVIQPGTFDNRSIAFTSDFPSAQKLRDAHIESVIVVSKLGPEPASDLIGLLRSWQRAGIGVLTLASEEGQAPKPYRVRGSVVESLHLWFARARLRRRDDGGFGEAVHRNPHGG